MRNLEWGMTGSEWGMRNLELGMGNEGSEFWVLSAELEGKEI